MHAAFMTSRLHIRCRKMGQQQLSVASMTTVANCAVWTFQAKLEVTESLKLEQKGTAVDHLSYVWPWNLDRRC